MNTFTNRSDEMQFYNKTLKSESDYTKICSSVNIVDIFLYDFLYDEKY